MNRELITFEKFVIVLKNDCLDYVEGPYEIDNGIPIGCDITYAKKFSLNEDAIEFAKKHCKLNDSNYFIEKIQWHDFN